MGYFSWLYFSWHQIGGIRRCNIRRHCWEAISQTIIQCNRKWKSALLCKFSFNYIDAYTMQMYFLVWVEAKYFWKLLIELLSDTILWYRIQKNRNWQYMILKRVFFYKISFSVHMYILSHNVYFLFWMVAKKFEPPTPFSLVAKNLTKQHECLNCRGHRKEGASTISSLPRAM